MHTIYHYQNDIDQSSSDNLYRYTHEVHEYSLLLYFDDVLMVTVFLHVYYGFGEKTKGRVSSL